MSQSDTFVIVVLLTVAFLTLQKKMAPLHLAQETHTQFVICLLRLDTNDLAYDAAKRCD